MASLLEVAVTFVGAMLVLALAAQSLQEVVKSSLAIKSWARLTALRRLILEAAVEAKVSETAAADIMKLLIARLRNLGQKGLFKHRVRLDVLDKTRLEELIKDLDPTKVDGLHEKNDGKQKLAAVGAQAAKWFDLSMEPVTDRHRRRMQLGAVLAGLVVVVAANADAFWILKQARDDPAVRAAARMQAESLSAVDSIVQSLTDSLERDTTAADSVWAPLAARLDDLVARRDSMSFAAFTGDRPLFPGYGSNWKFSLEWLVGILISVLLVGLGAPFWHDLLESVVGMKDRVRQLARAPNGNGGSGTTVVVQAPAAAPALPPVPLS